MVLSYPKARHEFDSPHGDAFTLLNLFDQWIKVKSSKPKVPLLPQQCDVWIHDIWWLILPNQSSRSWCKTHSVEEQRMYEIVKLKGQFRDTLVENGLLISTDKNFDDGPHYVYTKPIL